MFKITEQALVLSTKLSDVFLENELMMIEDSLRWNIDKKVEIEEYLDFYVFCREGFYLSDRSKEELDKTIAKFRESFDELSSKIEIESTKKNAIEQLVYLKGLGRVIKPRPITKD